MKNLDDLGRLAAINARLADPRGLSGPGPAARGAGQAFYYVQAGIHATEVGNSQAMIGDRAPARHRQLAGDQAQSWTTLSS